MFYILFIVVMACLARMAGGGLLATKMPKPLPEICFGACFGIFAYAEFHSIFLGVLVTLWCYLWMETGHGVVLQWGDDPQAAQGKRKQFLTPVVNMIAKHYNFEVGDKNYCRAFMFVKGFLIGLPCGGIPLAIGWPLAYEIGHKFDNHAMKEYLSGAFAALAILLFRSILYFIA